MSMIALTMKRVHVCTVLLLSIACPTRQESGNLEVLVTVYRGSSRSPDRLKICPAKPGVRLIDSGLITSKTMSCREDAVGMCGGKHGEFIGYNCMCKADSPSYVVSERQCVNNVWIREGCLLRYGSWRYSSGWTWNELDDPLLSLFLDDGFGITGGFNASNREFEQCTLVSVTALTEAGLWENIQYDSRDITLFVFKGQYHITWDTENLDSQRRQNMRGKILRFSIKCQPPEPFYHNDILRHPTESCLAFKVTGNFTAFLGKKESPTDKSKGDNTVAIALGVTFLILLLAGVVVGVICYRRRRTGTNITPRFLSGFMARIT